MAERIDSGALPSSAMFDSSVLVPALGRRVRKTDDAASKDLFSQFVAARKRVLIAAPSLAELCRREPKSVVPRTKYVEVVDFDRLAAELLGKHFPPSILVETRNASGGTLHYIKYDAMIVACAVRHRAVHFITTDPGQRRLASLVGLTVHAPSDYLAPQQEIEFPSSTDDEKDAT